MVKMVECVPNFSEGRDLDKVERIINAVRGTEGVRLLDCASDSDHNRTVVTFTGDFASVKEGAFNLANMAASLIDMREHHGAHPRMGAIDVIPFIPVGDTSMEECIAISKEVGRRIGEQLDIPVYLYEESASRPERRNLADIRRGQYEGFFEKIKDGCWKPDFGPRSMNERSGVCAVGARLPLVAFNVNLGTDDIEIANSIAKRVRHIGGGLRFVKAIGVKLQDRNIVQVSMNLVNFEKTAVYQAFEMVKMEARRYGVPVLGSEIIGMVPAKALIDSAAYYLQIEKFSMDQVLEKKMAE